MWSPTCTSTTLTNGVVPRSSRCRPASVRTTAGLLMPPRQMDRLRDFTATKPLSPYGTVVSTTSSCRRPVSGISLISRPDISYTDTEAPTARSSNGDTWLWLLRKQPPLACGTLSSDTQSPFHVNTYEKQNPDVKTRCGRKRKHLSTLNEIAWRCSYPVFGNALSLACDISWLFDRAYS